MDHFPQYIMPDRQSGIFFRVFPGQLQHAFGLKDAGEAAEGGAEGQGPCQGGACQGELYGVDAGGDLCHSQQAGIPRCRERRKAADVGRQNGKRQDVAADAHHGLQTAHEVPVKGETADGGGLTALLRGRCRPGAVGRGGQEGQGEDVYKRQE